MKKMNPVVHFEMPYVDGKRVTDFYAKVFGWHMQMLGKEMGNYTLLTTTEIDAKTKFPKKPGAINGGFYQKEEDWPAQFPSLVIAIDNIKEAMKKVTTAGGKVLGDPVEIPGYGLYVSFLDSEGNRVSIMQPSSEWKR